MCVSPDVPLESILARPLFHHVVVAILIFQTVATWGILLIWRTEISRERRIRAQREFPQFTSGRARSEPVDGENGAGYAQQEPTASCTTQTYQCPNEAPATEGEQSRTCSSNPTSQSEARTGPGHDEEGGVEGCEEVSTE